MITETELRRLAAQAGVDPMLQDLDYGIGWFVAGLFNQTRVAASAVFKGGTCLGKCYFPSYRFSEDVDVTLTSHWDEADAAVAVQSIIAWSANSGGPDFAAAPPRVETVSDDYGQESLEVRVYYRAALRWDGSPRAIRLDMNRGEHLAFPIRMLPLLHPYSDADRLGTPHIPCYSLEEILCEKLRAIGGQRRFAISRDIYDIYHLLRNGVTTQAIRHALPPKFAAKSLDPASLSVERLAARRAVFATDWRRRLAYLLPPVQPVTFDEAWNAVLDAVAALQIRGE